MKIKNTQYNYFRYLKILALLFLFLFSYNSTYAQAPGMWRQQSTGDTNYTYNSVYFTNHLTGWVAGTHGKIFKTTDGGKIWIQQLTNSHLNYFQKITGLPTDTAGKFVFACGYVLNSNPPSGIYQETTNGGTIWMNKTLNFLDFKNMNFINAYTGFVIGGRYDSTQPNAGRILRTTNGGTGGSGTIFSSYEDPSILNLGSFRSISFINTNTGWITATNTSNTTRLLKTTNMGNNWNLITNSLTDVYITDLKFINELTGFACGGGANGGRAKLLKTTDGGNTWDMKTYIDANSFNSMSWVLWYPPSGGTAWRGYVCGENGMVLRTDDLGNNWIQQITPNINNLNGIYFPFVNVGWAVGNNADIITTPNGGVNVNNISTEIPSDYKIYQNFPNPFNPTTTIKFDILKSSFVSLQVFDQTGRIVEELVNQNLKSGSYSVNWDAKSRPSGIYYYRISTPDFTKTMKMSLVK